MVKNKQDYLSDFCYYLFLLFSKAIKNQSVSQSKIKVLVRYSSTIIKILKAAYLYITYVHDENAVVNIDLRYRLSVIDTSLNEIKLQRFCDNCLSILNSFDELSEFKRK